MGLMERDLWACTPRYFAALQRAHIKRQQAELERARFVGYLAASGSFTRPISVTQFWRFGWEEESGEQLAMAWKNIDPDRLRNFNEQADENYKRRRERKVENGNNSGT